MYVVGRYANYFFGVFSWFCSISRVLFNSAGMLTISLVFSVGSVVFPACSLIRDRWVILRRVGCMVVVLVLASAFLHVMVSISQGIPWKCH